MNYSIIFLDVKESNYVNLKREKWVKNKKKKKNLRFNGINVQAHRPQLSSLKESKYVAIDSLLSLYNNERSILFFCRRYICTTFLYHISLIYV